MMRAFDALMYTWYTRRVRTTISIPDTLLSRAKRAAAARGATLSEVVVDALRAALERPSPEVAKPFKLITFRGDSRWPDIDFDRTSELLTAEDESRYRVAEAPIAYRERPKRGVKKTRRKKARNDAH